MERMLTIAPPKERLIRLMEERKRGRQRIWTGRPLLTTQRKRAPKSSKNPGTVTGSKKKADAKLTQEQLENKKLSRKSTAYHRARKQLCWKESQRQKPSRKENRFGFTLSFSS